MTITFLLVRLIPLSVAMQMPLACEQIAAPTYVICWLSVEPAVELVRLHGRTVSITVHLRLRFQLIAVFEDY
jgi:hypothetical protein